MSAGEEGPAWFRANLAVTPTEGWSQVQGCPVHWLRWGTPSAPPLLLVHGGAAHGRWWSFLAPLLARDYCVVAPELSGMGDSGWRDDYRTETWADEVLTVAADALDLAGATPPPVLVAGHSMGATVAAVAAARRPDRVRGVVLCDMGVRDTERRRSRRRFTNLIMYPTRDDAIAHFLLTPRQACANDWALRYIAASSVRPVGPGGPGDPARPGAGHEIGWSWKFDWGLFARTSERPLADYLAEVRVPVAALHGADSRLVDAEVARRTEAALGRPLQTVWLAGAGHHLMLDQPLAFVDALSGLLGQLQAG